MRGDRTCGECVACCVYLPIKSALLTKAARVPCEHLRVPPDGMTAPYEQNCTVFGTDSRPAVCEAYFCEWRNGHGLNQDRPDRSGVLIDNRKHIENAVQCISMTPEAVNSAAGRGAVLRISRDTGKVALVIGYNERRLVRVVGQVA